MATYFPGGGGAGISSGSEFQTNAETLCCLLAPEQYRSGTVLREQLVPIQQVLRGSRDLTFGSTVYRPEQAGYNDAADVREGFPVLCWSSYISARDSRAEC
jgi:hypothetical protein